MSRAPPFQLFLTLVVTWGGFAESTYAWPYVPLENRWSIGLKREDKGTKIQGLRIVARTRPSDSVGARERVWIEIAGSYANTERGLVLVSRDESKSLVETTKAKRTQSARFSVSIELPRNHKESYELLFVEVDALGNKNTEKWIATLKEREPPFSLRSAFGVRNWLLMPETHLGVSLGEGGGVDGFDVSQTTTFALNTGIFGNGLYLNGFWLGVRSSVSVLADPSIRGVATGNRSGLIYDPLQPTLGFQFQEFKATLPPIRVQLSFSPPLGGYLLFGKTSFNERLQYLRPWGGSLVLGYRIFSRIGVSLGSHILYFTKQKTSLSGMLPIDGGLMLVQVFSGVSLEF